MMGLDTSHGAWHGAYGSFSIWRREVAVAAGIIEEGQYLYNYSYDDVKEVSPIDWEHWGSISDAQGNWTEEPDDPIWYLLQHSDCEGVIKHEHLLALADRLEPLIPLIDDPDSVSYWRSTRTQTFVEGLRRAHADGEDLDFH